jgi:hypothetical protein
MKTNYPVKVTFSNRFANCARFGYDSESRNIINNIVSGWLTMECDNSRGISKFDFKNNRAVLHSWQQ